MKKVFENAFSFRGPSSSRHNGRSRREQNEFHRIGSSDLPNVHFQRPQNRHMTLSKRSIPIELKQLQDCNQENNVASTSSHLTSHSENLSATQIGTNDFHPFAAAFNVYNPTSEEIPPDLRTDSDDMLPFELSGVRLQFREMIATGVNLMTEDDDTIDEELTFSPLREESSRTKKCCGMLKRCGRPHHAIFICTLLIFLMSVVTLSIFLLHRDKKSAVEVNFSDLAMLPKYEWLLPDIESTEHKNNHGGNSIKSSATPFIQHSGVIKFKGQHVDGTIIQEIFREAEEIIQANVHANSTKRETLAWKGIGTRFATVELTKRLNIPKEQINSLEGLFQDNLCEKEIDLECNKTGWYRAINGSCNNVIHSTWGSQMSPFRTIISRVGKEVHVPLADSISLAVSNRSSVRDPEASGILPLWGLFILHDTLKIAESPPVSCCNMTGLKNQKQRQVMDKVCTRLELACTLNIDDSPAPAIFPSCKIEPQKSFNLATSFIDGSNIYGSSDKRTNQLRLGKLGKMKVKVAKHTEGKGFLPLAKDQNETCLFYGKHMESCFISGDDDINHFSGLTALHTTFLRQHNGIAYWLHRINPHWNDERLFQESRRIVIAQIQHITYNEFLPTILGKDIMQVSGLVLKKNGDFEESFDRDVNPSVSDAFAGAAGYFWYSMAVGKLKSIWKTGKHVRKGRYDIGTQVLNPKFVVSGRGHLEAILRGFLSLTVNRVGLEFAEQLRAIHIKPLNMTVDIIKMILEKGRKLQLAPYVEWLPVVGFPAVKSFEDVQSHWYPEAYETLTSVYKTVEQVDLFTGMLAENPIPSARIGPTLAYILVDQFLRFKKGDRFWYENDVYFHHFTEAQLKSIRRTTLSKIICDNTDQDFDEIQRWTMLLSSPQSNSLYSCKDIEQFPNINFHLWKTDPKEENKQLYNESDEYDDDDHSDDWGVETEELDAEDDIKEPDPMVRLISMKENVRDSLGQLTFDNTSTTTEHHIDTKINNV